MRLRAILLSVCLFALPVMAGSPSATAGVPSVELVKDVNPATLGSFPNGFVRLGSFVYFAANPDNSGRYDLWKTDGTPDGTSLVMGEIAPGNNIVVSNNALWFAGFTDADGYELWTSNGDAGPANTHRVTDIVAGPGSGVSNLTEIVPFGTGVIFVADDGGGPRLWIATDGSGAAKVQSTGTIATEPSSLTPFAGKVFFSALDAANGNELWSTDGTNFGTQRVADINPGLGDSFPECFGPLNATTLLFRADDGTNGLELWSFDTGTAAASLVEDINPSGDSRPCEFTQLGAAALFSASGPDGDSELWRTEGTEATTAQVADILPGPSGSFPRHLTALGSVVLFSAIGPGVQTELFKTDGSTVELVKDINPGSSESSDPRFFTVLDATPATALFSADDGSQGRELWKTDGTELGTVLVKDIHQGGFGSFPYQFVVLGSKVIFGARDLEHRDEVFVTNGTPEGTSPIVDLDTKGDDSNPQQLMTVGDELFFVADDPDPFLDETLWKSDGTPGGTQRVKEFGGGFSAAPCLYGAAGNLLIFAATDPDHGMEIWRSDGTEAGTQRVSEITPGIQDGVENVCRFGDAQNVAVSLDGFVYFEGHDEFGNDELWRTNGASVQLVAEVNPGPNASSPQYLTAVGHTLYFQAFDPAHGVELWKTKGTPGTTKLVKDLNTSGDGNPVNLRAVGSQLYFAADDGKNGSQLWKSDGTASGTRRVTKINASDVNGLSPGDLTPIGKTVYFRGNDGEHGYELWRSDGTARGTRMVKDIETGPSESQPGRFQVIGKTLVFVACTNADGCELWASKGTAKSTVQLTDLNGPDEGTGNNDLITTFGYKVFFVATTPATGRELWQTDGTPAGTVPIGEEVNVGPGDAIENAFGDGPNFGTLGSTLFFPAFEEAHGRELWKAPFAPCTIIATTTPATIGGTSGNDVICGSDGNDTINGGGGNDYIYGEGGDDVILGGGGRDYLDGGKGADTCKVGADGGKTVNCE